jgi:hypothetical protein
MTKVEAIALLGGTGSSLAMHCGITPQAVSHWPQVLTKRMEDRVYAALWRDQMARVVAVHKADEKRPRRAVSAKKRRALAALKETTVESM